MARPTERLDVERPPGDAMLQRHAVEKLHGDEGLAIVLSDLVDGADVGMIERRGRLRFALKAGERLRIARDFVGQEFQGDETVE